MPTYKKYLISPSLVALKGLIAYAVDDGDHTIVALDDELDDLICIEKLQPRTILMESFPIPLEYDAVFIRRKYLVPYVEQESEQMTDNPFGEFISSGRVNKSSLEVVWTEYERSLNVKVFNKSNTLFSHNYMGENVIFVVKTFLQEIQFKREYDWDELIFDLATYVRE